MCILTINSTLQFIHKLSRAKKSKMTDTIGGGEVEMCVLMRHLITIIIHWDLAMRDFMIRDSRNKCCTMLQKWETSI